MNTHPQNPQRSEDINLSCKSTQARLAASWGYVKAKPLTDEQIKKEFEKWAKENYVQGFEPYGDSYHNVHTRNRWEGWLAAHRNIQAAHGIGCETTLVKAKNERLE